MRVPKVPREKRVPLTQVPNGLPREKRVPLTRVPNGLPREKRVPLTRGPERPFRCLDGDIGWHGAGNRSIWQNKLFPLYTTPVIFLSSLIEANHFYEGFLNTGWIDCALTLKWKVQCGLWVKVIWVKIWDVFQFNYVITHNCGCQLEASVTGEIFHLKKKQENSRTWNCNF